MAGDRGTRAEGDKGKDTAVRLGNREILISPVTRLEFGGFGIRGVNGCGHVIGQVIGYQVTMMLLSRAFGI